MPSDVYVVIADPQRGVVVTSHYIGGNGVARALPKILRRAADHTERGFDSWGRITPDEMREIIEYRYWHGVSAEMLTEWVERFPPAQYLWCITNDY